MNSICLSTDSLPVLGLDVAKKSVQAELRTAGGKTVRFGFENNAKGFAQLACVLKEHNVPKVWAGLEATGPYSHALALWCAVVKNSPSCCRRKRTAWKVSRSPCALLSRAHDRYPERREDTLGKAHYS